MMERGTPRDIRPDPRFLDLHVRTPKIYLFKLSFWKEYPIHGTGLWPSCDRITDPLGNPRLVTCPILESAEACSVGRPANV